ncbi:MAG TPA: hypothetical protein VLD19_16305, partial [Chitinophagaceae bacterium]|nr:hypothetical protein [Chitinophagaceae bacterium]
DNTDQLSKLYESLNAGTGGLKNMMGSMSGGGSQSGGPDSDVLPQITAIYDVSVKKGLYSRKVNKQRYEVFSQTMKPDQLKQMSSMMGPMNYTLVVTLPQSIKKTSNAKAVLSKDKKTVTLQADLLETFEHPELLELDIEY